MLPEVQIVSITLPRVRAFLYVGVRNGHLRHASSMCVVGSANTTAFLGTIAVQQSFWLSESTSRARRFHAHWHGPSENLISTGPVRLGHIGSWIARLSLRSAISLLLT